MTFFCWVYLEEAPILASISDELHGSSPLVPFKLLHVNHRELFHVQLSLCTSTLSMV